MVNFSFDLDNWQSCWACPVGIRVLHLWRRAEEQAKEVDTELAKAVSCLFGCLVNFPTPIYLLQLHR